MQTIDIGGSLATGKKSTTTINLTRVHQFLPGQYCPDEDMYVSPDGIAYRERPYDVTGTHIPIPGGHNLIRPPYLPNSNSRQKPRHIPNVGNEGSSAADRMKAVIHIFVTLKAL